MWIIGVKQTFLVSGGAILSLLLVIHNIGGGGFQFQRSVYGSPVSFCRWRARPRMARQCGTWLHSACIWTGCADAGALALHQRRSQAPPTLCLAFPLQPSFVWTNSVLQSYHRVFLLLCGLTLHSSDKCNQQINVIFIKDFVEIFGF